VDYGFDFKNKLNTFNSPTPSTAPSPKKKLPKQLSRERFSRKHIFLSLEEMVCSINQINKLKKQVASTYSTFLKPIVCLTLYCLRKIYLDVL
jgi:hypothetical protein